MIDKFFREQIGKNMEVYIDDMVVKIPSSRDHCIDLEEIFIQLRKNNMHLNPNKCTFGVEVRKFLEFIITRRRIKANLNKWRAILEVRSPSMVKEV